MLKNKKLIIIIACILIVLLIALAIILILFKNKKANNETYEERDLSEYEQNFMLIFNNTIPESIEGKIEAQHLEFEQNGKYKMDLNLPIINIENETALSIKREIYDIFKAKLMTILQGKNTEYTIYDTDFVVFENKSIISIAIKCTLKEGTKPQRLIIKTFNYDIESDKLVTLNDVSQVKNIDLSRLQGRINSKIAQEVQRVEALKAQGYDIYARAANDERYNIDNIEEFMIDDKNKVLYVLYPYGNDNFTSEIDVVVYSM